MSMIKYINKVEMIDAESLVSSTFFSRGVMLSDTLSFVQLCTVGLSSLEISEKVESKNRIFQYSLNSKLESRVDVGNRKLCFRVTAVDGTQYLLGTDSRPFPVVHQEDSRPSELGQSCAVNLDITWKSKGFFPVL